MSVYWGSFLFWGKDERGSSFSPTLYWTAQKQKVNMFPLALNWLALPLLHTKFIQTDFLELLKTLKEEREVLLTLAIGQCRGALNFCMGHSCPASSTATQDLWVYVWPPLVTVWWMLGEQPKVYWKVEEGDCSLLSVSLFFFLNEICLFLS